MGGAAKLDWKRRSAAELDWMWVRRRFELGLEEQKLKSGATDLRLWGTPLSENPKIVNSPANNPEFVCSTSVLI